jgi:tRNA 2-thiouridine synthesizing protein A
MTVDALGLHCPLPIIQLARAAKQLDSGLIQLIADDPATRTDVPAWCRLRSNKLLGESVEQHEGRDIYRYLIQIRPTP